MKNEFTFGYLNNYLYFHQNEAEYLYKTAE